MTDSKSQDKLEKNKEQDKDSDEILQGLQGPARSIENPASDDELQGLQGLQGAEETPTKELPPLGASCGDCKAQNTPNHPCPQRDDEGNPPPHDQPAPPTCPSIEPNDTTNSQTSLSPHGQIKQTKWIATQTQQQRNTYQVWYKPSNGELRRGTTTHLYDNQTGTLYIPVPPAEIENTTTLPNNPSTRDVETVLNQIKTLLDNDGYGRATAELPDPFWKDVIGLYTVLGAVHDLPGISEIPYLAFGGDAGAGKSRTAVALQKMTPYSLQAGSGSSIAYLYRTLDEQRPCTAVMTEIDLTNRDSGSRKAQILNAGYSKEEGFVGLCDGENNSRRQFYAYGPKVFCLRGRIAEDGLRSRSIEILMEESDEASLRPFSGEWEAQAQEVVDALTGYRIKSYFEGLNGDYYGVAEELRGEIKLRILEILLGLFRAAPPGFEDLFRTLAQKIQKDLAEGHENTLENLILEAYVRESWSTRKELRLLSTGEIWNAMIGLWGEDNFSFSSDKAAYSTIGKRLQKLGFQKVKKESGVKRRIGSEALRKLLRSRFPPGHDVLETFGKMCGEAEGSHPDPADLADHAASGNDARSETGPCRTLQTLQDCADELDKQHLKDDVGRPECPACSTTFTKDEGAYVLAQHAQQQHGAPKDPDKIHAWALEASEEGTK